MRNVTVLLLMVTTTTALAVMDGSYHKVNKRENRELLLSRSKRRWVLSTIELVEEDPGPFPKIATQMFNTKITGESENHRFQIRGMGVDEDPVNVFEIDPETGVVYALQAIDREKYNFFHIHFDILDKVTGMEKDKPLAFDVAVNDINDNAPFFQPKLVTYMLPESTKPGYMPVTLYAYDIDQEGNDNSRITITVQSQLPTEPKFSVEQFSNTSKTGHLTMVGCFDYEKIKKYQITIEAKDHGNPALSSTGTVILSITDSNTHAPVFKQKEFDIEIMEMETKNEVLRIAVEDKDTPGTPGWRAKFFFIKGNEDGNYKIVTDPKTNEGILSVIKGKDYERASRFSGVQIGVKNEEELFICGGTTAAVSPTTFESVNITVKVLDVNDPPHFEKTKANIYQKEEDEPGKLLYTAVVTDEDSDVKQISYGLLDDPAGWLTMDEKTGQLRTKERMDRESPFVDENSIYRILVTAVDDGEPPGTATATLFIHLGDINDNLPQLVNETLVLCGNNGNKIIVPAKDMDIDPFSGPFTFALGGTDETLKQRWKLDPATGDEVGLINTKSLPYGNYSVPLVIQDQQGVTAPEAVLVVKLCDCGEGDDCLEQQPLNMALGGAAIGLILGAMLLFLLLLLAFVCEGGKRFQHIITQDEGNQTLIQYNEEGGGSACTAEPTLILSSSSPTRVTDEVDHTTMAMAPMMISQETTETFGSSHHQNMFSAQMMDGRHDLLQRQRSAPMGTLQSMGGRGRYSTTWNSRMASSRYASGYMRSFSNVRSDQHLEDHIERRLYVIGQDQQKAIEYKPYEYAFEGLGSKCQSLDELSLSNAGDDLEFLNDLGSHFKTLGAICRQDMQERSAPL